MNVIFMLIVSLCPFFFQGTEVCEQWYLDVDNNSKTGYRMYGLGVDVIVDVHDTVRSVFGSTDIAGWGGIIPATILLSNDGDVDGWVEFFDCQDNCTFCRTKSGSYEQFFYSCDSLPAENWAETPKSDLRHIAEWINCFGRW